MAGRPAERHVLTKSHVECAVGINVVVVDGRIGWSLDVKAEFDDIVGAHDVCFAFCAHFAGAAGGGF